MDSTGKACSRTMEGDNQLANQHDNYGFKSTDLNFG